MTDYIDGLDRKTYDFSKDGKIATPKNNDSRTSIEAVLSVIARDNELGVIVDEATQGSVHNVKLTQIDTRAEAVLSINYGGNNGYHAKVTLGNGEQVSPHGGSDTVVRKIVNYLKNPTQQEVKKKTGKFPVVGRDAIMVPDLDHKYSDLEADFE